MIIIKKCYNYPATSSTSKRVLQIPSLTRSSLFDESLIFKLLANCQNWFYPGVTRMLLPWIPSPNNKLPIDGRTKCRWKKNYYTAILISSIRLCTVGSLTLPRIATRTLLPWPRKKQEKEKSSTLQNPYFACKFYNINFV